MFKLRDIYWGRELVRGRLGGPYIFPVYQYYRVGVPPKG